MDKIAANPLDPDANTVAGKYLAFVKMDFDGAMPYLVHSKDKTLKALAEHELDPVFTDNPEKKVGMADEWVAAAKKLPQLTTHFYDRASQWYVKAWPDLTDLWKAKAREQGKKISASRPPGGPRKALPINWLSAAGISGKPSVLDGTISRTGSYSVKLIPGDEKVPGAMSSFKCDMIPVSKGSVELTAFIRSDGTENPSDRMSLLFFDAQLALVVTPQTTVKTDSPFWTRVTIKADIPEKAAMASAEFYIHSKKGNIWVDDVSVKVNGKEVLSNGGFEVP